MSGLVFKSDFRQTLECPICYDYYTSPIFLCPNGHSICSICSSHSCACPLCRAIINPASCNLALEKLLDQITIACKFKGCNEVISLGRRQTHYQKCPYNNYITCHECQLSVENLVSHLISMHEYKEINMDQKGGRRSFSGPYDSWIRDTEWPKGVWRFGTEPIIVYAKSAAGIFHVFLYKVTEEPISVSLKVTCQDFCISFKGTIPHIKEFKEKQTDPHFNCEVNLLLNHFINVHEDDGDIYRLWVNVKRKLL